MPKSKGGRNHMSKVVKANFKGGGGKQTIQDSYSGIGSKAGAFSILARPD